MCGLFLVREAGLQPLGRIGETQMPFGFIHVHLSASGEHRRAQRNESSRYYPPKPHTSSIPLRKGKIIGAAKLTCATAIPDAEPLRDTMTFDSERKTFVLNSA